MIKKINSFLSVIFIVSLIVITSIMPVLATEDVPMEELPTDKINVYGFILDEEQSVEYEVGTRELDIVFPNRITLITSEDGTQKEIIDNIIWNCINTEGYKEEIVDEYFFEAQLPEKYQLENIDNKLIFTVRLIENSEERALPNQLEAAPLLVTSPITDKISISFDGGNNYVELTEASLNDCFLKNNVVGKDVVVNIPKDKILYGIDNSTRHYTQFPNTLSSITFMGEGTFTATKIPNNDNIYTYFHGVPVTIDGITWVGHVVGGTVGSNDPYFHGPLLSTKIIIKNGAKIAKNVIGGSPDSDVDQISIDIGGEKTTIGANIIAGCDGDSLYPVNKCNVKSIEVIYSGGTGNYLYTGGAGGTTVEKTRTVVSGGVLNYVFGGGHSNSEVLETDVTINGTATILTNVFGGGGVSSTTTTTNVKIDSPNVSIGNSVYGGGMTSSQVTNSHVTVESGNISRDVYGGGYGGRVTNAEVIINDGIIGTGLNAGSSGVYCGGKSTAGAITDKCKMTYNAGELSVLSGSGNSTGGCLDSEIVIPNGFTLLKNLSLLSGNFYIKKDVEIVVPNTMEIKTDKAVMIGEDGAKFIVEENGAITGHEDSRPKLSWNDNTWIWKKDKWRPLYTITFEARNGELLNSIVVPYGLTYDEAIVNKWPKNPVRTNSKFMAWSYDENDSTQIAGSSDITKYDRDHTIYANWTFESMVQHYLQNSDGTFGNPYLSEQLFGVVNEEINVQLLDIPGYTLNRELSQLTGVFSANQKVVLHLYYNRTPESIKESSNDNTPKMLKTLFQIQGIK